MPTIAHELMRTNGAAEVIGNFFINHLDDQTDGDHLELEDWMNGPIAEFYRVKVALGK